MFTAPTFDVPEDLQPYYVEPDPEEAGAALKVRRTYGGWGAGAEHRDLPVTYEGALEWLHRQALGQARMAKWRHDDGEAQALRGTTLCRICGARTYGSRVTLGGIPGAPPTVFYEPESRVLGLCQQHADDVTLRDAIRRVTSREYARKLDAILDGLAASEQVSA